MKKLILFITLLLGFNISAQIGVGPVEQVKLKAGEFEKEDLQALKNTTTIFAYGKADASRLADYKKAIEASWTVTPIKIVPYTELKNYLGQPGFSFLTIAGFNVKKTNHRTDFSYENTHIYLNLWMPTINTNKRKPKVEKLSFCRIELYPDFPSYTKILKAPKSKINQVFYEEARFYNFLPGMIKSYLAVANDYLTKGEERWFFKKEVTSDLKNLKRKPLLIPDYCLIKFNKFTGDESERHDVKKLLGKYPYKYKVVSAEKLDAMLLEENSDINYLVYVKSSVEKHFTIYNSKSDKIVYNRYKPGYNLKSNDFKELASVIK